MNYPQPAGQGNAQLYGCLLELTRRLNQASQAVVAAPESRLAPLEQEAVTLRQLILKNAQLVQSEIDTLYKTLEGSYVAQSDFGTYIRNLSSQLSADPTGIDQYYSFLSVIQAGLEATDASFREYITKTEGYIRTGIVYYEEETPVYGVAVGQGLTVTEADGEQEVTSNEFRSVFTAKKLSFFRGDQEVAYLSNDRLYITDVTVLHALQFGQKDNEQWEMGFQAAGFYIKWLGETN